MSGRFTCDQVARAALGEPVRRVGSELLYRCPQSERHANGDAHPSLKVNPKKDIWGCFVCGVSGTAYALAAFIMGSEPSDKRAVTAWLRERGLLNGKPPEAAHTNREHLDDSKAQIVAKYDYEDEIGELLFQVIRVEPKGFRQRRPDGFGGWLWNLDGARRVLYRLREVLAETDILVCEGEKDCDTACKMGIVATCNPGGAGKWRPEFTEVLGGKKVVVIPDADEPGRKHALHVAQSLVGKVESLRVLKLPAVKDFSEWVERGGTKEALSELIRNTVEWKQERVEGAQLLDQIAAYIRRFVSLSEFQAWVAAVWIAHTHAFDAADATPYLAVTSAEKQSGKTRLLEVFQTLVANPWFTGRVTAAVLTRKIDRDRPSLLLDESDAAFGGEKEYAEALRGILNTGHRLGGTSSSCVGQGASISCKDFSTFSPKAIAGIGKLPDTVADRAIPIRLKRAAHGEKIERFRLRDVNCEATRLRSHIEAWCTGMISVLRETRPQLPEELTDRQQDGAEPLLAIVDLAGGDWPRKTRQALIALCTEAKADDGSIRVLLLTDIRETFLGRHLDVIFSADLVAALCEIETSPWAEWQRGKPLSLGKLASLLHPFEVSPRNVRISEVVRKGYTREDFADAWQRYLPGIRAREVDTPAATPATSFVLSEIDASKAATRNDLVAPEKVVEPAPSGLCSGVASPTPKTKDKGLIEVEV